jgi:hypothetical protein
MSPDARPPALDSAYELLRDTLTTAIGRGVDVSYGLALFPRTGRFDAPVFGVATLAGESLTLTYRLLRTLADRPAWLSGRVAAVVREGAAAAVPRLVPPAMFDQPVLRLAITLRVGLDREDAERTMPLESLIFAADLVAPIILLFDEAPPGWPR